MPEGLTETLRYMGPFSVFCVAMFGLLAYVVMRDRRNQKAASNNKAGSNPSVNRAEIEWQAKMTAGQESMVKTLDELKEQGRETVRLLAIIAARLGGQS